MPQNKLKTGGRYVNILNVRVDSTDLASVLKQVEHKLASKNRFYIVTPNPEIIMAAQNDKTLTSHLNSSDFSLPDGVGLAWASKFLDYGELEILPGRKVMLKLFELANRKSLKIFLFGSTGVTIKKSLEKMKKQYPNIHARGLSGPKLSKDAEPITAFDRKVETEVISKVNNFSPDLLFVALGAPKQEKWVAKWISKLNVGGAMVVGGSLDYFSGVRPLPPVWMEESGLEWLWKLLVEPWRIKRVFIAAFIFPLKVLGARLNAH